MDKILHHLHTHTSNEYDIKPRTPYLALAAGTSCAVQDFGHWDKSGLGAGNHGTTLLKSDAKFCSSTVSGS